jgi:hypothetical protein
MLIQKMKMKIIEMAFINSVLLNEMIKIKIY